ncbi:MAG: alpha/beta hydrolase, partial [Candidatus Roizmanbacteria bacterium]|nr:alpha/beta hydrolase [Candidatus Roizmanbacteria bacterium]
MNFLILPGWCLPSDTYRNLKRLLEKKGHRVYVVDFPGFKKKLTKPLNLNDYVEFIRDYISQHNISRPVIIGHSFGGRVALRLLSTYPSTASPVILTGVPGYRSESS